MDDRKGLVQLEVELDQNSLTRSQRLLNDVFKKASKSQEIKIKTGNAQKQLRGLLAPLNIFQKKLKDIGVGDIAGIAIARQLVGFTKSGIANAMTELENANLFKVMFRGSAQETAAWSDSVADALDISEYGLRRNLAMAKQMTDQLNLTSGAATTLGRNITLMGQDVASLFDADQNKLMDSIRGAISGAPMAARQLQQYGVYLTQANIQEEAFAMGINKSNKELSSGELALVRYNIMARAFGVAQGDMAQTMDQPANAMRRLKDSLYGFGVAVGNLVVPAISAIIPPLIAVVQVAERAILALGRLFGIKPASSLGKGLDDVGTKTGDIEDGFDGVGSGIGGATKAAKEFQKVTQGFDEMNIIKTPDDTSGGGGGGGGSTGSISGPELDWDIPEWDSMLGKASSLVDKYVGKIDSFFKSVGDTWGKPFERLLGAVAPFTAAIWDGLKFGYDKVLVPIANWTISNLIPTFFDFMAGVFRVLAPVTWALVDAGKFLINVFITPLARILGAGIIGTLKVFSGLLTSLGVVLNAMRPVLSASMVALGLYIGAYQVSKMVLFLSTGTSVVGMLKSVTKAMTGNAISSFAKYNNMIVDAGKYFVKDLVPAIGGFITAEALRVKTLISGAAATISMKVATTGLTSASTAATIATTTFGTAVQVMMGPIGWATLAIGAIVGGLLIYNSTLGNSKKAMNDMDYSQRFFAESLATVQKDLANASGYVKRYAEEVIPGLNKSYSDLYATIESNRLGIENTGLDALLEQTTNVYNEMGTAIKNFTNESYGHLRDYYATSTALSVEEEQATLNALLMSNGKTQDEMTTHYNAAVAIVENAKNEKRDRLYPEELAELNSHLDAMNTLMLEKLTVNEENRNSLLFGMSMRREDINKTELENLAATQEKAFQDEYDRLTTKNKQSYDSIMAAYEAELGLAEGNAEQIAAAEDKKNRAITELETTFRNDMHTMRIKDINDAAVAIAGADANTIKQYEILVAKKKSLENENTQNMDAATLAQHELDLKRTQNALDQLGITETGYDNFKTYLSKLPDDYEKSFKAMNGVMDFDGAVKNFKLTEKEAGILRTYFDKQPDAYRKIFDKLNSGMNFNVAVNSIKGIDWWSIGRNVANDTKNGINSLGPIKMIIEVNKQLTGDIELPQFATGNVATRPTLGIFGEYANAKMDPEITSPQSMMRATMIEALNEAKINIQDVQLKDLPEVPQSRMITEYQVPKDLDKPIVVYTMIDGKEVAHATNKVNRDASRLGG